jgi:hypothetical protein
MLLVPTYLEIVFEKQCEMLRHAAEYDAVNLHSAIAQLDREVR